MPFGETLEGAEVKSFADSTLQERIRKIAGSLAKIYGDQKTVGSHGIEYQQTENVLKLPTDGTVFGWVADILRGYGVTAEMQTVGDVMQQIGINRNSFVRLTQGTDGAAQQWLAHAIGCHCHRAEMITGTDTSVRLLAAVVEIKN